VLPRSALTTTVALAISALCGGEPSLGVFKRHVGAVTGPPTAVAYGFGEIWFTEPTANRIGVLRSSGKYEEFEVPTPDSGLAGIAAALVDAGSLVWFTESKANRIGRIAPDGTITEFPVPTPSSEPWGIATDVLGTEVWFSERAANAIARIDSAGNIREFPIPTPGVFPTAITMLGVNAGYDIWVTSPARNSVGHLPWPNYGSFAELVLPNAGSEPFEMTVGPDYKVWFTERSGDRIGRVEADGTLSEFALAPGSRPYGIQTGLSGNEFLWFTESGSHRVGTITPEGQVTEYALPPDVSGPTDVVTDGNYAWFGSVTPPSILRTQPDEQLFVGAGSSGPWESRIELASSEDAVRSIFLGAYPFPPHACPGQCFGFTTSDLPARGTVAVRGPFLGGWLGSSFVTVYGRPLDSGRLPAAHYRFTNAVLPTQAADAPVTNLSAISALDPTVLAFPSASSSPRSKSNLFLANVGQDGALTARVEAFKPDGTFLGTTDLSLESVTETIVADVLHLFGAGSVENAQVRVTKTGGDGLLWGMLATVVGEDGTLTISSGTSFAVDGNDTILIAGGGVAGTWDTILDLANPLDGEIVGELRKRGGMPPDPCPPSCADATYRVPANGTARVLASSFQAAEWAGTRLLAATGGAVVHARVVNRANPVQAADLPTIPLSRLAAVNPNVLVFPSARRDSGVRTNLFLAGVGGGDPIHARVEALAADGTILAQGEVDVASWDQPGATFVVDLLAHLGVPSLDLGQVRVIRESGGQLLWGALSNVYADGRLSVVAPALQ
jgi:virginiamycin B lyase